ncbi:MAG: hypothetical protein K2X82_15405 [Gemmataceae bacterium]|nr:hypothetical protein [Gemmataceae bacterium]
MTFGPRLPVALALAACGVLGSAGTAPAAWNNVFQLTCNDCNRPSTSYSLPAACPQACPQPQMQISYVQRCYYQPVTEMVRKSYYEAVTKNVTSYYYEPVQECRYATYYDPCTGCPQRVSVPTTSYRLRSKCNSVTSYVERCAMVPVTTLRPVTVRQPVVTYYYPPQPACPDACPPTASPLPAAAGPQIEQVPANPPTISQDNTNIPNPMVPATPPGSGSSYPRPNGTTRLRPDKTTSRSGAVAVRGEVVSPDQLTPRAAAKLVFVNADQMDRREYVTANQFGEFDVKLPGGTWYLYLGGTDGRAVFHKTLSLGDKDSYDYRVVSR